MYAAEQQDLGRKVAIKFLHNPLFENSYSKQRFEREAKILSALEHQHLVTLYALGFYADSIPYQVSELIDGVTLAQELHKEQSFSAERTMKIGVQVCLALEYVHNNGCIHRDLKPQNIMLAAGHEEDYVKVVDFGLAKMLDPDLQNTITRTGEIVGSTHYLSPEQCSGKPADKRSDIYSLACVLYECLCAQPPFVADQPMRLLYQHCNEIPRAPSELSKQVVPESLDRVLLKALQKDPDQRYQSMREFADALNGLLLGSTVNVELAEFDRREENPLKRLWIWCAITLCLAFIFIGTQFIKKQENEKKAEIPAPVGPFEEVERMLADPELNTADIKTRKNKLGRIMRLMIRGLSIARPNPELEAREFAAMDRIAMLAKNSAPSTEEWDELESSATHAIGMARGDTNRYNDGLMVYMRGSIVSARGGNPSLFIMLAATKFAIAGCPELAKKTLKQAKLRSEKSRYEALLSFVANLVIEESEGNHGVLTEQEAELRRHLKEVKTSDLMDVVWELIWLAKKENNFDILELCYLNVGYSKQSGDGMYKESLLSLAKMYEERGRYDDALKALDRLRECGVEHGNIELINRSQEALGSMRKRMNNKP